MNEEENTNQSAEPVETTPEGNEAPAPSLDEIANEFSVEEQANQFQAQPTQSAPAPQYEPQNQGLGEIPDPTYDPDGYTRFMQQQAAQQQQTNQLLNEIASKVSGYEEQMARQKVEADLNNAVTTVNEKLGIDPALAEAVLETEYRKNPAFQKIWDNRSKNPKAFKQALGLIGDKYAGQFASKFNDQLVENVRAAKSSQQTLASSPKEDGLSEWADLSPAEFERKWRITKGN